MDSYDDYKPIVPKLCFLEERFRRFTKDYGTRLRRAYELAKKLRDTKSLDIVVGASQLNRDFLVPREVVAKYFAGGIVVGIWLDGNYSLGIPAKKALEAFDEVQRR
jgi:hypothetical protein